MSPIQLDEVNKRFADTEPREILRWAVATFGKRIALCTAFGPEAMVLLHSLSGLERAMRVFTLDTGRLPRETHDLMQKCEELYGLDFDVCSPEPHEVQELVRTHGINLFYKSVDLRARCCEIRKVRPLHRVLNGLAAWVTGLRRSQAATRQDVRLVEIDTAHRGIVKVNPLAQWSEQDVWDHISRHQLPYNALHDRGYRSIGCAPCTRATNPGEDIRAGRWWWERSEKKECGLHTREFTASEVASVTCDRNAK